MRDFIFKPELDAKGDVDRTRLKKELARMLGDRMADGKAKYLFSAEPLAAFAGEWFRLRTMVELPVVGMKEIPIAACTSGVATSLSAWVALESSMFKPAGDPRAVELAARCRNWLERLCRERFDGPLDLVSVDVAPDIRVMTATSRGSRLSRPYGHVRVEGVVRDESRIMEIQRSGIGEARAYGFGLVASRAMK